MELDDRVALAANYKQRWGLKNAAIADILRVDISSVSRYLAQAERNRWLVPRFELCLPPEQQKTVREQMRNPELECAIRRAFEKSVSQHSLNEVVVASDQAPSAIDVIGVLGGELLIDVVSAARDFKVLGVAWGRTTHAMTSALLRLSPIELPKLEIVPLQGGLGLAQRDSDQGLYFADTLAQKMADFFQTESPPHRMPLPAYVDAKTCSGCSDEGFESILSFIQGTQSFQHIRSLYETLDVALVGIGGFEPDAWVLRSGFLSSIDDATALSSAGVCGDIVCRFYRDIPEDPIESMEQLNESDRAHRLLLQVNRRAIGISLRQLKERALSGARVIGLAGGSNGAKANAILGALINGLITDLVTDSATAKQLISRLSDFPQRRE